MIKIQRRLGIMSRHGVGIAGNMPIMYHRSFCFLFLLLLAEPAFALCGGPLEDNAFGRPIDAQDPSEAAKLATVEHRHFTPEVQKLRSGGGTTTNPADDLHYTLRQLPNHYGALRTMAEYQLRVPYGTRAARYWSIDCYFERATTFRPNDGTLYMLYASYQHRAKRYDDARTNYAKALDLGLDSPELYYNWGLTEFATANYDEAARLAGLAYAGGYPLPGLKNKLAKVGRPVVLPKSQQP
jgi:tetratricopeptide (TPR) repeat protein